MNSTIREALKPCLFCGCKMRHGSPLYVTAESEHEKYCPLYTVPPMRQCWLAEQWDRRAALSLLPSAPEAEKGSNGQSFEPFLPQPLPTAALDIPTKGTGKEPPYATHESRADAVAAPDGAREERDDVPSSWGPREVIGDLLNHLAAKNDMRDFPRCAERAREVYEELAAHPAPVPSEEDAQTIIFAALDRGEAMYSHPPVIYDLARKRVRAPRTQLARYERQFADMAANETRLAAQLAEAKKEIATGDYWMTRVKWYMENGGCPVCFATDEDGHTADCEWGQAESQLAAERERHESVEAKLRRWQEDAQEAAKRAESRAEKAKSEAKGFREALEKIDQLVRALGYKASPNPAADERDRALALTTAGDIARAAIAPTKQPDEQGGEGRSDHLEQ